jgi:RHS repeat-associated protein
MLVTETNEEGTLIKDYIWNGMTPIAQIERAAETETIIYLYADHLMTNRLATNSTQTIVWRWEGEAFGNTPAEELAGIQVNMRFPGQYYDSETNLHYNNYRYYDPQLGRYITSDPVGLYSGTNTYSYADANPIVVRDFLGLNPRGRGERGATGGSSGQNTANKYKHCENHPTNPNKIRCKHHQTGKKKDKNKPSDWPKDKENQGNQEKSMCSDNTDCGIKIVILTGGATYVIYRCIRMFPSLFPPLWPTIPANATIP